MRINCEAATGPGLREGSSVAITAGGTDTEMQLQLESSGGLVPSTQQVLNLAAFKYLQTIDPSKPEDMNGFVQYLKEVRKVLIVDTKQGSLIITVECSSLEILDKLWFDYCTGYLNEMAQKYLVTEEILNELGLSSVKLTSTILGEEYITCRNYFLRLSGELKILLVIHGIACVAGVQRGGRRKFPTRSQRARFALEFNFPPSLPFVRRRLLFKVYSVVSLSAFLSVYPLPRMFHASSPPPPCTTTPTKQASREYCIVTPRSLSF